MPNMYEKEVLDVYRSVGALLEGHFILSSGLHSKIYLQSALIFSRTEIAKEVCKKLANLIKKRIDISEIDIIVSLAMGGIILGYEISRQLVVPNIFLERVNNVFDIRRGFNIKKGSIMPDDFTSILKEKRIFNQAFFLFNYPNLKSALNFSLLELPLFFSLRRLG